MPRLPVLARLPLPVRCALVSLLAVVLLGIALVSAVGGVVREHAVAEASRSAEIVALFVRQELPPDADTRDLTTAEGARLDEVVAATPTLRSLRLWGLDGRVQYDSDERLDGQVLPVGGRLRRAYDGEVDAHLEQSPGAENPDGPEELLEVYVPLQDADRAVVGVVEVYLRYDASAARTAEAGRTIAALLAAGLGALWALTWWLSLLVLRAVRRTSCEQAALALTDELTGLPNRRALLRGLEASLASSQPLALLLLDLDRFKEVNDTLGHHVGDELLRLVGARLVTAVQGQGTVVRLGGDEFAVQLDGVQDPVVAVAVAQRITDQLEQPFLIADRLLGAQASVGVALSPRHASAPGELLQRADVAMYTAKQRAAGVAVYDVDQDVHSPDRLALLGELRAGLDAGELWLAYQPIYDLQTHGRCHAVEALLRWDSPRRGSVPPAEFVPLCERTGLVRPLTRFVLDEALRQVRAWEDAGTRLKVGVNLSSSNLAEDDLPEVVAGLLARHGLSGDRLVLEITESAVIPDPQGAARVMHRLVALGVDIAIDDFGTGWSSMSRLLELPLSALKVDRSFVADLPDGPGAAIVHATTGLAHDLGLLVVAEGIETVEQLTAVVAAGCDVAQGYLMARPLAPADVPAAVRRNVAQWLLVPLHV